MAQYDYVEDYLMYIAGYGPTSKATIMGSLSVSWGGSPPPVQLANYDVSFVDSAAIQVCGGVALTDRQATLAERLIVKYERQLRKLGIEQPEEFKYKLGIRKLDRTSSLTKDGDVMVLKFPYNEALIKQVRNIANDAQGRVEWNKDLKVWEIGITEFNVSWAVALCQAVHIAIDKEVLDLFNLVTECEKVPFSMELTMDSTKNLYVSNAPASMLEWMQEKNVANDLYSLLDHSGVLEYTVDPAICEAIEQTHGKRFLKYCQSKEINANQRQHKLADILEWAKMVQRFPIVVFNPHSVNIDLDEVLPHFDEHEIMCVDLKSDVSQPLVVPKHIKLVYANRLADFAERIPLLISYVSMMISKSNLRLIHKADKIVWHCENLKGTE